MVQGPSDTIVCVVGLGYVGHPLAGASSSYKVKGDLNGKKKSVTGQDTPSPHLALTHHITIPLF